MAWTSKIFTFVTAIGKGIVNAGQALFACQEALKRFFTSASKKTVRGISWTSSASHVVFTVLPQLNVENSDPPYTTSHPYLKTQKFLELMLYINGGAGVIIGWYAIAYIGDNLVFYILGIGGAGISLRALRRLKHRVAINNFHRLVDLIYEPQGLCTVIVAAGVVCFIGAFAQASFNFFTLDSAIVKLLSLLPWEIPSATENIIVYSFCGPAFIARLTITTLTGPMEVINLLNNETRPCYKLHNRHLVALGGMGVLAIYEASSTNFGYIEAMFATADRLKLPLSRINVSWISLIATTATFNDLALSLPRAQRALLPAAQEPLEASEGCYQVVWGCFFREIPVQRPIVTLPAPQMPYRALH